MCQAHIDRAFVEKLIPEDYLKTILEICGRTSRVYRIMKCLHQDYVLIGTTEFKLNFMKSHMMKDVRTDDGWKILITLADIHTSCPRVRVLEGVVKCSVVLIVDIGGKNNRSICLDKRRTTST